MTDDEVEAMFKRIDTDGSGYIDYSEFVVAATNEKQNNCAKRFRAVFDSFDKDGGGTISINEIKRMFAGNGLLSDKLAAEILAEVDSDGDGEVSWDEFISTLMQGSQESCTTHLTCVTELGPKAASKKQETVIAYEPAKAKKGVSIAMVPIAAAETLEPCAE